MTILSIYFITFVQSDRPLLRYTVFIVKFSTFTTVFFFSFLNNFDIKKYLFYPNRPQEIDMFCVTIITIKSAFQMHKRNLISLISRKMTNVETFFLPKIRSFFFENVVKDKNRWNKNIIIRCHKVSNITLSTIYIWNPCMFWYSGFCFSKGGGFL